MPPFVVHYYMATILVQTTLRRGEGEWPIDRFSTLVSLLRDDGHDVIARNREPGEDGSDPVLSALDVSAFDELWLFAADRGNGLAPADVRGILRFRERGGGIFTARDGEDIGLSLLNLGTVGVVNHFRAYNRPARRRVLRRSTDRSDGSQEFERIVALEPVHELLRTPRSPSGVIEYFPAAVHDAAMSVPRHAPTARVIAVSANGESGTTNNVVIAIEDERGGDGQICGRAVATSCLHRFADDCWSLNVSGPVEAIEDFARNVARWLATPGQGAPVEP